MHPTSAAAVARRAARLAAVPDIRYPDELPVSARRVEILEAIREHQVVVVAGETGSGKTTQIPKMCLELGRGVDAMIGHTQPRRIAARTVAERLAEELEVPLGGAVGYAVRFTDTVGPSTLVKVMTDGILLAEIRRDRSLSAYDTIIVDEAHERSLNVDFLLGYLTQLLPKRPDLKVIVTSATIDTARFAEHFSAPVVQVSGRTYPVEIRYRPLSADDRGADDRETDDQEPAGRGSDARGSGGRGANNGDGVDRDPGDALCDAVGELVASGPGDVLVFLAGERDIRDAADALRSGGLAGLEIVPLYARLSAAEQHRVFRPHTTRRVVLATNVAETSLTVPGIRFVVDTGLARISRFSHRTKVQRLPIEPVSRASADQRAGRCGRVAPGTCIRLYSEQDFAARPEFTEPEILRTNLASVMLQMAALGLGAIETFPFLEPPDRRSVADGSALLEELGAFETREGRQDITPIGRRLAELPLDPRLGRMVVEAERRACLREVTVIAAGLAVQDPRERPADAAQAADELHRRFVVPGSDFLGFVALWDYLADLQSELSGNQFRRRCRAEHLNVLRVREWQDVAGQIRRTYRAAGVHANSEPARPEQIHQALLSGLLSQIGMRDAQRGDFEGARGSRWQIGRSSALAKRPPAWAMAGALVETDRTWARTVAHIEPAWAESLGVHQVRRSISEPWWDARRGEAMADERVTLYGLPVVGRRPVSLARFDPIAARQIFLESALVERDWPVELAPLAQNHERVKRVRALEERVRRTDLVAGDDALYDFYDARVPAEVTSGRRFLRWWRDAAKIDPSLLHVSFRALLDKDAPPIDLADYPSRWPVLGRDLPLRYRWEPGAADDGVTVELPVVLLNQLDSRDFDWHVPGFRAELITTLLRTLPKHVRRSLQPIGDFALNVLQMVGPADGPLLEVVAGYLRRSAGELVTGDMWDLRQLPPHLRISFSVVDDDGTVLAVGRDLELIRVELHDEVRSAVARAAPDLERHGATTWEFGDIAPRVERSGALGYPALVDEGDAVGVVLLDSPRAQAEAMRMGTRRLLLLASPLPAAHLQRRMTSDAKLVLARSSTTLDELAADCAAAVADEIVAAHGGPTFVAVTFEEMAVEARAELVERVARLVGSAAAVVSAAEHVGHRVRELEERDPPARMRLADHRRALADVAGQVDELIHPGFVGRTGATRVANLPRYLAAASLRLDRLTTDGRRDAERQAVVDRVRARFDDAAERLLPREDRAELGSPSSHHDLVAPGAPLAEIRWMIEELRVSLWAQSLGTAAPVSEQRILRALDRAIRESGRA